jgi:hypothetical protein
LYIQTTCNFLQPFQTKKATINQSHNGGVGNCTGVVKIQNYNIFSIKVWATSVPGRVCPGLKGKAGAQTKRKEIILVHPNNMHFFTFISDQEGKFFLFKSLVYLAESALA